VLIAHIKSEPDLIRAKDENGNTVLHLASRNGHLQIVEILCQVVFAV
jgi:ankyrin repeat protein